MSDKQFLQWIADRFVFLGENKHVDFILRLHSIAESLHDRETPNHGTKMESTMRWNIETLKRGKIRICLGEHERHEGCQFVTYFPESRLEDLKTSLERWAMDSRNAGQFSDATNFDYVADKIGEMLK